MSDILNVFVSSLNCGKLALNDPPTIQHIISKCDHSMDYDYFIFGFQEIISLGEMGNPQLIGSKLSKLSNLLIEQLTLKYTIDHNNPIGFELIATNHLGAIGLIIIAPKSSTGEDNTSIIKLNVRCGYFSSGLKGGSYVRLVTNSTKNKSFSTPIALNIIVAHLTANEGYYVKRTQDIEKIMDELSAKKLNGYEFYKYEPTIFFGDLNFRCTATVTDTKYSPDKIESVLNNEEELTLYLNGTNPFNFHELHIGFPPTYKYVLGSFDEYKSQKRIPSWCDRILINDSIYFNLIMEKSSYQSVSRNTNFLMKTDHQCVVSTLSFEFSDDTSQPSTSGTTISENEQNLLSPSNSLRHIKNSKIDDVNDAQDVYGDTLDYFIGYGCWLHEEHTYILYFIIFLIVSYVGYSFLF
ncbi:uncharacterized protein SCODWIG_01261 [Saccharomycodes ludwigii]|uniref:Inositol polyphosphate-related phosphatase domain-containing protein n=1 Tax=Saccharomycodes ludwigii TaxID=36035 RepID=A0A376B5V7_9ASCO|nr:uncharacterized protein SCODWIG_01261 [Saccharomycodes ludwigii]